MEDLSRRSRKHQEEGEGGDTFSLWNSKSCRHALSDKQEIIPQTLC